MAATEIVVVAGVTAMEVKPATVRVVVLEVMPRAVAVIVVVPAVKPAATPVVPLILATVVFEELQETVMPGVIAPLL